MRGVWTNINGDERPAMRVSQRKTEQQQKRRANGAADVENEQEGSDAARLQHSVTGRRSIGVVVCDARVVTPSLDAAAKWIG